LRVLIVEDQNVIRQGLRKIISEIPGVEVDEASDGAAAWAHYRRCPSDLVITDIVMPDMDGLELIERICKVDDACAAIVISGYDKFEYARRAMAQGVRDYLLKPMRREKILSVMRARKKEFDQRREREEKIFSEAWSAALAGEEEKLRIELAGMTGHAAGYLVIAKSATSVCPSAAETGYLLCRKIAEVNETTALFFAFGEYDPACSGEQVETAQAPIESDGDLAAAFLLLAQRWQERKDGEVDEAVRRMLMYVNRHYNQPLSLQYVAEKVGLHPNYLSALFARNMQCGFTHYLQRLRIEKAKTLLRTTSRKISDIALSVGFTDGKYFAKVFKSITGVTPQQYRVE
jgi:two-component system response regulator YesN